jgi:hypothetical protein
MIGPFVMTENELMKRRPTPESVGMGSYGIDSHNIQRYITPEALGQNEGDIGVGLPGPYEIAYGALVPKRGQATTCSSRVRLEHAHRLRLDPHGAGVHDPGAVRRHRRGDGHRCRDRRSRICPIHDCVNGCSKTARSWNTC